MGRAMDRWRAGNHRRQRRLALLGVSGAGALLSLVMLWLATVPEVGAAFTARTSNLDNAFNARTAFPTYSQSVSEDGPAFYYRFGDSSGTAAADSGPNNQPGGYAPSTATTAQTYGQTGPITGDGNAAVWCNGSTSYLVTETGPVAAPDTFTIEAWFKTSTTSGGKIIGFGNSRDGVSNVYDRHIYMRSDGRLTFGVRADIAQTVTSVAAYNDGDWHHVVGTVAGLTLTLYVDGARVASLLLLLEVQASNGYWRMCGDNLDGWTGVPPSRFFEGTVDEVAVYATALSSSRVSAHYNGRTSPDFGAVVNADNPYLFWRLGESGARHTFRDSSGNNRRALNFLGPLHLQQSGALTGGESGNTSAWFNGQSAVAHNPTAYSNPGFSGGANGLTVELWFRTATLRGGAMIGFGNGSGGAGSSARDRLLYMLDDGRVRWGVYPGSVKTVTSSASYDDGAWHLAHGTVGPSGLRLYVDGTLVASDPTVTTAEAITSGYWHIGYESLSGWPDRPTTDRFSGYLDEVAVYHRQLSDTQISSRWYRPSSMPAPNPATQLLKNPGFESGNDGDWSVSRAGILSNGGTYLARTGSWKAWLGGAGTTRTDTLSQTVTIPAEKTTGTLGFWLGVDSAETTTTTVYDTFDHPAARRIGERGGHARPVLEPQQGQRVRAALVRLVGLPWPDRHGEVHGQGRRLVPDVVPDRRHRADSLLTPLGGRRAPGPHPAGARHATPNRERIDDQPQGLAVTNLMKDPRMSLLATRRRSLQALVAGVTGGLLLSGALIWSASHAAFTATTNNPGNNWTAGTVVLSDDDTNSAMFSASNLKPGSTGNRCIKIDYTGSLAASVKLYGSQSTADLSPYLNLTIEEGSGGNFGDCTGFTASGTVYTGTLQTFATTSTNHSNGVGTFAPTGSGQSKVYKITYTVDPATPDSAQGANSTATFTWEAQNS